MRQPALWIRPRGFSISASNLNENETYEVLMRVGIVSAFGKETRPIRSKLREIERDTVKGFVFFLMKHRGKEIMMVKTGSGKTRGAQGTQLLIHRFHPDVVINCGVAGAISPERKIGHVVISERVIEYDAATEKKAMNPVYHADEKLITCARHVSQGLFPEAHVVTGDVLSGDLVINETRAREDLWNRYQGQCVDQEGAGVAKVCQSRKIPWIVIRGISDRADEHALEDFKKNMAVAARNAALITFEIMNNIIDKATYSSV